MRSSVAEKIVEEVKDLPPGLQRQVLAYVKTLNASGKRGVPGRQLLRFAGSISPQDLERMSRAIDVRSAGRP